MALVSRDPFARTELHKAKAEHRHGATCDWCGQTGDGKGNLYEFRTESDGGRSWPAGGRFCSVSCFRSYHG